MGGALGALECLVNLFGFVSTFGLAHAMGVQVVITSSSDEKLARAQNLGANRGINYKSTPDWEKTAMEFTGGLGVDRFARGQSRHVVAGEGPFFVPLHTIAGVTRCNSFVTLSFSDGGVDGTFLSPVNCMSRLNAR